MEQAAATTVMVPERYVGVALIGRRDPIKKIVGNLALLK